MLDDVSIHNFAGNVYNGLWFKDNLDLILMIVAHSVNLERNHMISTKMK